jgi:DNA-binding CsgD family transcriptional regulator
MFGHCPRSLPKPTNLTPAELRILLAIVEVGGVPDVAEALGIAESTVKTHLGRLFQKTETSRQAGLVGIVAGFATPSLADSLRFAVCVQPFCCPHAWPSRSLQSESGNGQSVM